MRMLQLVAILLCLPAFAFSAVLEVPTQYASIQEAIDSASNNDIILVLPGVYFENLDLKGKAIVLRSESGPNATIIDGSAPENPDIASVIRCLNNEGADTVIEGFTLTHGKGIMIAGIGSLGGGVFCWESRPTIRNNIIHSNIVSGDGGAIYLGDSNSTVENNLIYNNTGVMHGGGIAVMNGSRPSIKDNTICYNATGLVAGKGWGGGIGCKSSMPLIHHNHIFENYALIGGGGVWCKKTGSAEIMGNLIQGNTSGLRGGGIHIINQCHEVTITNNVICSNVSETGGGINYSGSTHKIIANNTIFGNEAEARGGGIFCDNAASITISNMILWNNEAPEGPELWTGGDTAFTIRNSNCQGGEEMVEVYSGEFTWGQGMIDADPLFVDPASCDFHLTFPSPCRDGGHAEPQGLLPALDFEDDPRLVGEVPDMGADEFHIHLYYEQGPKPGQTAKGFYVGDPMTDPVVLLLGSDVLETAHSTPYGLFYLAPPLVIFGYVGTIPTDGILKHSVDIPLWFPAPAEIFLQALVGDELTNLYVLKVEEL